MHVTLSILFLLCRSRYLCYLFFVFDASPLTSLHYYVDKKAITPDPTPLPLNNVLLQMHLVSPWPTSLAVSER